MARTTAIEWTEHTWNPFVGCSVCTAGCTNCYAMQQAFRIEQFGTARHYEGLTHKVNGRIVWTGKLSRSSDAAMRKPLGITKPSMIFVNSMSDFFHADANDAWLLEALDIIRLTPRHIFQVLTKRPENISPFLQRNPSVVFPGNLWLGTTVEHKKTASRISILSRVPATVRFISFEPLIGSVGKINLKNIHWVISGGESGPRHRPCDYEWVKEINDQAKAQGVPHFFKQWGHWTNNPLVESAPEGISPVDWIKEVDPVGKGGSLLDCVAYKEFPSPSNIIAS